MSRIVAAREIDGGDTEFGSNKGNIGERTLRSLEALAGDVVLEVGIGAVIENGVVGSAPINLDDKLERIDFFGQLVLFVSETESFSPDTANFLVSSEQEPRFNLRGAEDVDESKATTTVIAANALRRHKDITVSGSTNVAYRFFVHRVEMCDEHNRSLPANEDKVTLADERLALEFLAEPLEELLLRGAQEVFQMFHAEASF